MVCLSPFPSTSLHLLPFTTLSLLFYSFLPLSLFLVIFPSFLSFSTFFVLSSLSSLPVLALGKIAPPDLAA